MTTTKAVAVAGATGVVGRHVVTALEGRGFEVRGMSRGLGVDLLDTDRVKLATEGVDAIVDVSNVVTTARRASVAFFEQATSNLLAAATVHGVPTYVALSIVGIDRVDYGYYEGKRVQERLIAESGLPATVVRATQFHEFAGQMLDRMSLGPVVAVPRIRCAPVAAAEVAGLLADVVAGGRRGTRLEIAGPGTTTLHEMVRRLCRARGLRRLLVPVPVPGSAGRLMATTGLLPQGECEVGRETFDDWLTRP